MSEQFQDLNFWIVWREAISYSLTGVGTISAFFAMFVYKNRGRKTNGLALLLLVMLWGLLGLYPIEWGLYTDRVNYAMLFLNFKSGEVFIEVQKYEIGFQLLNYVLSRFLNVDQYFFVISGIYLCNYYIAIRKLCRNNIYWMFTAVALSMGFVSYNLNTMRAGLAISFIVLALSMYPSKLRMAICLIIACSIHGSTIIPCCIIAVCFFFDNTSLYYKLWILAIPISFVAGHFFNEIFATLGEDSRTEYLTTQEDGRYNVGFRLDFILYSLVPMAVGAYYIFKQGVHNRFYRLVYNAYLLTNIFWILVIRANFSDRFAYLSWFLIPFILTYPLLTQKLKLQENIWLGLILCGETLFRLIR